MAEQRWRDAIVEALSPVGADDGVVVPAAALRDALAGYDALVCTRDDAVAGRQRAEAGERRAVEAASRLRAELAETRAVGDRVVRASLDIPGGSDRLDEARAAWRSVRGDAPAPAEPPVDEPEHVAGCQAERPLRAACGDRGPRIGGEGVTYCVLSPGHAGYHRADDSFGDVTWSSLPAPEPPAVGQCVREGLTPDIDGGTDALIVDCSVHGEVGRVPAPRGRLREGEHADAEALFAEHVREAQRRAATIVRAVLARPGLLTDPAIALVGTRDGARTYMAMADALGQIAEMVGLPADVDEDDVIVSGVRQALARSADGRDLTGEDGPTTVELLDDNERLGAALVDIGMAVGLPRPSATCRWGAPKILAQIATLHSGLGVPAAGRDLTAQDVDEPRGVDAAVLAGHIEVLHEDVRQARRGSTMVQVALDDLRPVMAELDRRGAKLDRLRAVQPRDEHSEPRHLDALRLIVGGGCRTFTAASGLCCRDLDSGRTRGARYGADAWCDACIAQDALDAIARPAVARTDGQPPAGFPVDSRVRGVKSGRLGTVKGALEQGHHRVLFDDGERATVSLRFIEAVPADEPPPPSPDPRGDGLCPNCPTDLATLDSGHGVCMECGWTSDPGKCMELYNRIDELENELQQLRAAPADDSGAQRAGDGHVREGLDEALDIVSGLEWGSVARTDGPTDVAGAERPANGSAPGLGASASTDGQPPVDEDERAVVEMEHRDRRDRAVRSVAARLRAIRGAYDAEADTIAVRHVLRAESDPPVWQSVRQLSEAIVDYSIRPPFAAAPADDTAAPPPLVKLPDPDHWADTTATLDVESPVWTLRSGFWTDELGTWIRGGPVPEFAGHDLTEADRDALLADALAVVAALRSAAPADDTAAPDHPLPWRRDGNSYLRSIVDANDVRVGWMHPPELAASLVKAVNQWGRRAIGVPVAVLDALPDRDPFADEGPAGQPVRDSRDGGA